MSKFELYNVNLKDLSNEPQVYHFNLDDAYFQKIDSPEVQRGNIQATVTVQKRSTLYHLDFVLDGYVVLQCTRCLEDMNQPIHDKENLDVKLGNKYSEENEVVIVPESEGAINVAWFLYEFVVLNIPIKHVHPPGECNKTMINKLKIHIVHPAEEEDVENDLFEMNDENDFLSQEPTTDFNWDLQNIDN